MSPSLYAFLLSPWSSGEVSVNVGIFDGAWLLSGPIRSASYSLFSADIAAGLSSAVSSTVYDLPDKEQEALIGSKFVTDVMSRVTSAMSQYVLQYFPSYSPSLFVCMSHSDRFHVQTFAPCFGRAPV